MWKLKNLLSKQSSNDAIPPAPVAKGKKSAKAAGKEPKPTMPHYLTHTQRLALQGQPAHSRCATSMSTYSADQVFPPAPSSPRSPITPTRAVLSKLSTSYSVLHHADEPELVPSSASTGADKSTYSNIVTPISRDENDASASMQSSARSPLVEAVLSETFNVPSRGENNESFDWERCTFHEDEEEAMWLPEVPPKPSALVGRRRSASAPLPYPLAGDRLAMSSRAVSSSSGGTPHAAAVAPINYTLMPRDYSMANDGNHGCFSPAIIDSRPPSPKTRQALRFALPQQSSVDNYATGSTVKWSLAPVSRERMPEQAGPTSPPMSPVGPTPSVRSMFIGQPASALSSPAHSSGFHVMSRQPTSPMSPTFYPEPASPAVSVGSAPLDWQRTTNELRLAGAQAIRDVGLHRAMSSNALSTPPALPTSSSASSSSTVYPSRAKTRSKTRGASQFSLLTSTGRKRRSRPATAETTQGHMYDDDVEVVNDYQQGESSRQNHSSICFTLPSRRDRRPTRGRPATADSADGSHVLHEPEFVLQRLSSRI